MAPGQNKQRLSVQALVFSRQSCNSTVLPPNGLVRVIETSQPAEAPPGDRILITEILNRVATSVGQQKAINDATAAAAAGQPTIGATSNAKHGDCNAASVSDTITSQESVERKQERYSMWHLHIHRVLSLQRACSMFRTASTRL